MNTGFICNNLSRFYMADNREKIVAFKTSSEFVALLNELCVQLGAGRSDVLRLVNGYVPRDSVFLFLLIL